jgi:isochorismate synthase
MELLSGVERIGGARPLVVGGFGFSDDDPTGPEWREFPSLRWFLPRLLWVSAGGRSWVIRTGETGEEGDLARLLSATFARARTASPGETPLLGEIAAADDGEDFGRRVRDLREQIAAGIVRKVVIARRRHVRSPRPPSAPGLLASLRSLRPTCFSFWLGAGETDFLGSSPERLVRLDAGTVVAGALAGTAPRGATPEDDRRLGIGLLGCEKNRREHDFVVGAVKAALVDVAACVDAPAEPELVLLPEAQHLSTTVRARLRAPATVVELAGRLHPTPAVCGLPREAARRIIERDEPERGWYCGGVGWMAGNGEGEIAVALRSALVDGRDVWLRAGAGIVEGSDPAAELAETEVKFEALLHGVRRDRGERAA